MTAAPCFVSHHPDEALLISWTAGALPQAHALVVTAHLEMCPLCRAHAAALEAMAGACLAAEAPAEMAPGACAAALARAKASPKAPAPALARAKAPAPPRRPGGRFPAALRRHAGGDLEDVRWSPIGGGARQCVLARDGRASARLLYIPPGAAMPRHGHRGLELTLVLCGSFSDESGRFERGDLEIAAGAEAHQPVAGPEEPCVCLASTEGRLIFRSWLPRLVQPFIRI